MNYLLDTHIILWWLIDPKKITVQARHIITDKKNIIFCSSVSFWELAIKNSLGRCSIPSNLISILKKEGFQMLPLQPEETLSIIDLPKIHQDPFDRMLIAQAMFNNLTFITQDTILKKYPIKLL